MTAPVPLDAGAYERIEALASAGLVRTALRGQLPYSRREVARLTAEARSRLPAVAGSVPPGEAEVLERLVAELERDYAAVAADDGRRRAGGAWRVDGAVAEVVELDSPGRPIADVGLGGIDAVIAPLAQGRGGRAYGDRATMALEAAASAEPGGPIALDAHVRGALLTGAAAPDHGVGEVRSLGVTVGAANLFLRIGRQPLRFGQGIDGGPFASRNAPGLDMIRVGNDVPAYLPWLFRKLGPARGTLFVADLGADQYFPHTKLAGWKVSFLPAPVLEVGVSLLSQQGGQGAPDARWHERVIDVFTIVDVLFIQDRDLLFSNKLAGFDVRWRAPLAELYFDGMADDFDVRRLGSSLWEDAGFVTGIEVPRTIHGGAARATLEYQHTGLRYYEHGQFRSGVTARGSILGLPLGPRGNAAVARLRWSAGQTAWWLGGAVEQRSGDRYAVTTSGNGDAGWRFVKTEDRAEERRVRMTAGWSHGAIGPAAVELEAGAERVANDAFVDGAVRLGGLARAALVLGFR